MILIVRGMWIFLPCWLFWSGESFKLFRYRHARMHFAFFSLICKTLRFAAIQLCWDAVGMLKS